MQLDKKKVVFGSVLLCILLFIVAYAVLVWKREEPSDKELPKNPNIPIKINIANFLFICHSNYR